MDIPPPCKPSPSLDQREQGVDLTLAKARAWNEQKTLVHKPTASTTEPYHRIKFPVDSTSPKPSYIGRFQRRYVGSMSLCAGEDDPNDGTCATLAFNCGITVVLLHDGLCDRQTKPEAACISRTRYIASIKSFENMR